jgi:oligopeptide/dipeptide ABC transporter ATP-binding protein
MLLRVKNLSVHYGRITAAAGAHLPATVNDVSFELDRGTSLGIVGESGSGKSTIVRALLRLIPTSRGSIEFNQQDWLGLRGAALRTARAQMQLVMQNPHASLDPQMRVVDIVAEPLRTFAWDRSPTAHDAQVLEMLRQVGLGEQQLDQYPHELSGGQAQRVSIARALISAPALLVCDEPLSALDVSIKAQIANLLRELQRDARRSMLLVSHELPAIRYLCQQVLVLFRGQVMELAPATELFAQPRHPYTSALLQAAPSSAAASQPAPGQPPSAGCVYNARCPWAIVRCAAERPPLLPLGNTLVACHRAAELAGTHPTGS